MRRNFFIPVLFVLLIVSGFFISNFVNHYLVKKDINNFVVNELVANTDYIKEYALSGKYSSKLSMTFSDDFDDLSIQKQWNVLNPLMTKYKHAVEEILLKHGLYEKALKDRFNRDFIIKTSKCNYEYDFVDTFTVNGKIYFEDEIFYANIPTYNPEPKVTVSTNLSYEKEPMDDDKAFAWAAALQEVKSQLKAPTTAKFPFSYLNEYIKEVAPSTFIVMSYVDAENSFGAKIRTNFVVKIEKTGEESYKLLNIQLSE